MSLLAIFIASPWLTAIPAAAFILLWRLMRKKRALALGLLWLGYGAYEMGMKLRLLCSGECNIRVDLLLIYPLLFFASFWVLATVWTSRKRP